MRDLICWLFGHKPFPGTSRHRAIVFHCSRCRTLVPGELWMRGTR